MRPEFLLRTSLQLRTQLEKLRVDANPVQTLDRGPADKAVSGCISRSDDLRDTCESEEVEVSASSSHAECKSAAPSRERGFRSSHPSKSGHKSNFSNVRSFPFNYFRRRFPDTRPVVRTPDRCIG
jgi:hypothetical protein